MRFTEGDRVRHRGLKFISGIIMRVIRIPDADVENERSYFCKVQLGNGQYYSDRASEWEPNLEGKTPPPRESASSRGDTLYAEMT
jgi:hypothetical protein